MLKKYYQLAKPGIIFGNLISTLGGFFLAARGDWSLDLLASITLGTSALVGSGCIINNYIDKDIDALMTRTQNRFLVCGYFNKLIIFSYAAILAIMGCLILAIGCNLLTLFLGIIGFIVYIFAYTLWLKRRSTWNTAIGSIAGAMPPVMGYCAVTNQWDLGACLLFLIFALWQIPHHYAIGIYRLQDYQKAGVAALPVVKGIKVTFLHIKVTLILFTLSSMALSFYGYTGKVYLFSTLCINLLWLKTAFAQMEPQAKAKKLFLLSIWVVCLQSAMMAFNPISSTILKE